MWPLFLGVWCTIAGAYGMTKAALISIPRLRLWSLVLRFESLLRQDCQTCLASALTENPTAKMYTDRAALRRFAQPEVAGALVYLASNESTT